jgi:hypothetical protein
MAVVSVSFDGTRVDGADALGTVWLDLGGGKTNLETDVIYEQTGSISEKVGTAEGGIKYYNSGTSHDFSTAKRMWLAKVTITNYGALNNEGSTGGILEIGSGDRANYYRYYVVGGDTYPPLGGWLIIPLDPNLAGWRDETVGSPSLSAVDNYSFAADFSGTSKVENVIMDAIDFVNVGAGLTLTGGDSTDPDGTFQDYVDEDQGTDTNRWGIVTTREGQIFACAVLTIGSATATVFNDTNQAITFFGARIANGSLGLNIGLQNATNVITITASQFKGRQPFACKLFFDSITEVDPTPDEITIPSHGFSTGDYVTYSNEGGTDSIGLTSGNGYWVEVVTTSTFNMHTSRQNAITGATPIALSDGSSGENHSIVRAVDARPQLNVTGTSGTLTLSSCTFDNFYSLTFTSAATMTGGFIFDSKLVVLSTGSLTGVNISGQTTEEGQALLTPLTTLANISNCNITAGDEGHFARLTATGTFGFSGNTLTGFWAPATNGWEFHTQSGVEPTTDIITMDAAHGFSTGDAVYYNDEGGTDSVGLTDLAKYYANAQSTTTVSLHRSRENATSDTNRIALSDGSTGETHSLYSGKAAIFNDSGGSVTINVTNGGTSPSIRNGSGASTSVPLIPVTTLVHVADNTGVDLQNARVWVKAEDGTGDLPFEQSISSITRSGTTATVTFASGHGLVTGDYLDLAGITDKTEDNYGAHQVTVTGTATCTYTTTDAGSTSYTGTITGTGGIIFGLTDANGDISRSRSFSVDQPVAGYVSKSSASPRFKRFSLAGNTVDSTNGLTINIRMILDE